ncbi:MAG: endonuclease III [Bdellovibrionales bacterium GWA2_49_15]|nr:MAG: endonuclease III [Bdellovibrionales bacterium GWA2_49_15]HAZ11996.1 endonuclease III [Bdellovibrionales bacterium]
MQLRDRAQYIEKRLAQLFPETPIPLHHEDPYTLLIAVVLSAQCTDERVNQVTEKLFARAKTPKDMGQLTVAEIEDIIRPCGLAARKAKSISELSKLLLERHEGQVPDSFGELEALPGVGHKTASVVMSQAFKRPAFPVDTHIHRLAQQWELTSGKNVEQTEQDLKKIFKPTSWAKLHLRFIYFGRIYCTSRNCDGRQCEICRHCFPERKRPKSFQRA